jgi:hypothetical protein
VDEPKFCVLCGVRPVGDGRVKTCSPECWEVFHGLAHMEWPVVLGASIRRVWLRAEVAGLVEDAADAFDEAVGAAETYEPHRVRTAAAVHRDALSRLARLAGGGA